jgi:hypothetical protein
MEQAVIGIVNVVDPHCPHGNRADHVGKVDRASEKFCSPQFSGKDNREDQREEHNGAAAREPEPADVFEGLEKDRRGEEFPVVAEAREGPFCHRVRYAFHLEKTHHQGAEDRVEKDQDITQYRRSKESYDNPFIIFQHGYLILRGRMAKPDRTQFLIIYVTQCKLPCVT